MILSLVSWFPLNVKAKLLTFRNFYVTIGTIESIEVVDFIKQEKNMKPLMLPEQKKQLTVTNDLMIAKFLQENEIKVLNLYESGFSGLKCCSCNKKWNMTFHKLRFNKVKCPLCYGNKKVKALYYYNPRTKK